MRRRVSSVNLIEDAGLSAAAATVDRDSLNLRASSFWVIRGFNAIAVPSPSPFGFNSRRDALALIMPAPGQGVSNTSFSIFSKVPAV